MSGAERLDWCDPAAVRVWLDRNGSEPRVIVEDLERGDYVSLNAVELSGLILNRQEHQESS